jgi:hypothetical protein
MGGGGKTPAPGFVVPSEPSESRDLRLARTAAARYCGQLFRRDEGLRRNRPRPRRIVDDEGQRAPSRLPHTRQDHRRTLGHDEALTRVRDSH